MKNYIFLIGFLLFSKVLSFDVPENLTSICPDGCKRYDYCNEKLGRCEYKGFFPPYPLEILEILAMCVSSALATACGIGGGTVYSALLLGVQEFEPNEAFPISNCLILTCGLVTYLACVLDKYKNPKNKFVHYDMAVIFGPSMLLGAKFGTIFNKIFSSTFLTIAVLVVLCYSMNSTYKNVKKARAREAKIGESLLNFSSDNNSDQKNDFLTKGNNETVEKIEMKDMINEQSPNVDINSSKSDFLLTTKRIFTPEEMGLLKEDDDPLNLPRIKFIAILEVIVIIDQLIEGNAKLPSFIGVRRCSFFYWVIFLCYIGISLYMLKIAIDDVQEHFTKRKQLDPNFKSDALENVSNNITKVVLVAVLAGIISSMVGIGGGMITNPMFASLGLDPKESSSTSNFLIITTAIASTFLFSFAGQLNYSYAFWVSLPCTIAAFIGSFMILRYINRTKKSSILLVIMLYFLGASLIIIIFKAFGQLRDKTIGSIFEFNSFC